jgi:hypothetical protein
VRTALTANDPGRSPQIRPAGAAKARRPRKRKGRLPVGEEELDPDQDMGAGDDAADEPEKDKKPKEKPEPEPAGPLVQRKSANAAAPPDAAIDARNIKAMPVEHGRIKFPPPAEDAADQEELDELTAARNSKMKTLADGKVPNAEGAEMGIDPNSLGSYHVQVSLSPAFRRNDIDAVYGFGTDIHLEYDLDALGAKTGKYYIRWALIDLLDMEHPFHKPKYFTYIAPVQTPEASAPSAAYPGGPSPR